MNVNDKNLYQEQFDRMLQPELWFNLSAEHSTSDKENLEYNLTKKLSLIAEVFFKQCKEVKTVVKNKRDLISKFFEVGVGNRWLKNDKLEHLEDLLKQVGLIGRSGRARVNSSKDQGGITKMVIEIIRNQQNEPSLRDKSPVRVKKIEKSTDVVKEVPVVYTKRVMRVIDRLRLGGDFNEIDKDGKTILHRCIDNRDFDLSKALIDFGADLDCRDSHGMTPLHYAASSSDSRVLDYLLKRNVNLEVLDKNHLTPLVSAVRSNSQNNVVKLLDARADIHHKDLRGKSVLHRCIRSTERLEISKLLISRRADISDKDHAGRNPLFEAVAMGNIEGVKLLLKKRVNPLVLDQEGRNVFNILKEYKSTNYEEIKKILYDNIELFKVGKEQQYRRVITHTMIKNVDSQLLSLNGEALTPSNSYEGMIDTYALRKLVRSFEKFSKDYPSKISAEVVQTVREAIEMALIDPVPYRKMIDRWLEGKPIWVKSGFEDHYISIVFWYDVMVVCNRGSCHCINGESSTQRMYIFDKKLLTIDVLDEIEHVAISKDGESYKELITSQLPEMLGIQKQPFKKIVKYWGLPKQTIGNCSWANSEAGIYALMWLHRLFMIDQPIEDIDPDEFETILAIQDLFVVEWQLYQSIKFINKYIKWVKDPENKLVPDFKRIDVALERNFEPYDLDQRLIEKWEKAKSDWEKAKSSWKSQTLCTEKIYRLGYSS